MLSVVKLSVIILSVIILSVIILSVIILSVIILSVIILSVIILSVVAPHQRLENCQYMTRINSFKGLHSKGRLLSLPANIRQGWK
jgi:hypothetical protein